MSTLLISAFVQNTDTQETSGKQQLSVTTTGNAEDGGRFSIGTTEETIAISTKVGNAGYCVLVNRDATNFIDVGYATGVYYHRLLAGGVAIIPLEPTVTTLYVKADTAAAELSFKVYEA